jgi:hypothetical protein
VSRLLSSLSEGKGPHYNLWKLVDTQLGIPFPEAPHHIICDIDKTYLETAFETLLGMAKIAFEAATDKITVSGACDLLQGARWGYLGGVQDPTRTAPYGLHFISSSPPQLRKVLEEKFTLDGLDWSSATLKNQAYNIKKGRFSLLKQQVAYKTAAILIRLKELPTSSSLYFLGDSAEFDAYIYIGISQRLSGELSESDFATYLEAAAVESPLAQELAQFSLDLPPHRVQGIWIRSLADYPLPHANPTPPNSPLLRPFHSYLEVGLDWIQKGVLSPLHLEPLLRLFHNQYGMSLREVKGYLEGWHPMEPLASPVVEAIEKLQLNWG